MGLILKYDYGQTPLDEDEKDSLKIKTISTKEELDEFEQQNIEAAIEWTLKRTFTMENIFTEGFVRNLHRKMYGEIWKWAGEFRYTEMNIGIDPTNIAVALRQLNGNGLYWVKNKIYPDDEIAIRYKHEVVKIHCFPNGNGRHSRLMADVIINKIFGKPVYSWGQARPINPDEARKQYLKSLKDADGNDLRSLIRFAKT